jgi:MoxR-like ATPase
MLKESDPKLLNSSIINYEGARWWKERLAEVGYYISIQDALTVHTWYLLRYPMIVQGPPGSGKTTLLEAIIKILSIPSYWLTCYEGITPSVVTYRWNLPLQESAMRRAEAAGMEIDNPEEIWFDPSHIIKGKFAKALTDTRPDVMTVGDEIDKAGSGNELENALLEFTGHGRITVNETNLVFERPKGCNPLLIAFTSNAGIEADRLSLSKPLLRRSKFIHLPQPKGEQAYKILKTAAPNLLKEVVDDAAFFVEYASRTELDKPLAISEAKMWIQTLEALECKELCEEVVYATIADLAKGEEEIERLTDATPAIFRKLREAKKGGHIYANKKNSAAPPAAVMRDGDIRFVPIKEAGAYLPN